MAGWVDNVDAFVADFREDAVDGTHVRFGHFVVPVHLTYDLSVITQIHDSICEVDNDTPIIFVQSYIEKQFADNMIIMFDVPRTRFFDYENMLLILKYNRMGLGNKPRSWARGDPDPKNEPKSDEPGSNNLDSVGREVTEIDDMELDDMEIDDMISNDTKSDDSECQELDLEDCIDYPTLPDKAFVIFLLDPDLGADCALSLIGLIQWAHAVSQREEANIRLLTVSSHFDSGLLSDLVSICCNSSITRYELPDSEHIDPVSQQTISSTSDDEIAPLIRRRVVSAHSRYLQAIVLVAIENSSWDNFITTWIKEAPDFVDVMTLHPRNRGYDAADMSRALESSRGNGVRIIRVAPDYPIPDYLSGFSEVHVVFGKRWKKLVGRYCNGGVTSQISRTFTFGTGGRQVHQTATLARRYHIDNSQAGGFIAGLYSMSSWGLNVNWILQRLMEPSVLAEMRHRLRSQAIIQESPSQLAFTDLQEDIFSSILPSVRYDYRLAHFVALLSLDNDVFRLKLQIAVILTMKTDFSYATEKEIPHEFSWGWGKKLKATGSVWMDLGVWKRVLKDAPQSGLRPDGDTTDSEGLLSVSNQAVSLFRSAFEEIEWDLSWPERLYDYFELPPHDINQEADDLTNTQLETVQRHLLQAFIHQLVCTQLVKDSQGSNKVDSTILSTNTKLVLSVWEIGDASVEKFNELVRNGVVFGICTRFTKRQDIIDGDWTWIPYELVMEWKDEYAPNQTLSEALSSRSI
ncbi:hypothetical protein FSARC_3441 [Fusarium sarcochroum]|uniref:Uncharacterized protein n=1 Tax=Fusarium sarcochroum TaxID=1208366 RepID=A0A8H4XCL8_9HYPO|nr:hypothetical protein FSARC_3441 [Fusarium sarcochroum]